MDKMTDVAIVAALTSSYWGSNLRGYSLGQQSKTPSAPYKLTDKHKKSTKAQRKQKRKAQKASRKKARG